MHFFYMPEITGKDIILSSEESKHCIRVLRLRKNETIGLVDGKGNLFNAVLMKPDQVNCSVRITEAFSQYKKRLYYLHVAIAPTKKAERFEWFLEKATEIGIDEITPLVCARSERSGINMERAERIIITAMKQSRRAYLPKLNSPKKFSRFITETQGKTKIITHCNSENLPNITKRMIPDTPAIIMIGPEGDFTADEVSQSLFCGFREAGLGQFVYRTETAGIMACHLFNIIFKQ